MNNGDHATTSMWNLYVALLILFKKCFLWSCTFILNIFRISLKENNFSLILKIGNAYYILYTVVASILMVVGFIYYINC